MQHCQQFKNEVRGAPKYFFHGVLYGRAIETTNGYAMAQPTSQRDSTPKTLVTTGFGAFDDRLRGGLIAVEEACGGVCGELWR